MNGKPISVRFMKKSDNKFLELTGENRQIQLTKVFVFYIITVHLIIIDYR